MGRPTFEGLTERRKEVLRVIVGFLGEHGYSPSFDDLSERLKIGKNAVVGHLTALRSRGYITWQPRKGRTIRVLNGNPEGLTPGGTVPRPARGTGAGRRNRSQAHA